MSRASEIVNYSRTAELTRSHTKNSKINLENLENVFKSNFLKDLEKEKNMDLSFESTEHNIYYPNFSSGNVTPRVVDHEPEDFNFNDYLGGLQEI